MPGVSVAVLLLTKNGAATLAEGLTALFDQGSPHQVEVVAVDSGSTDCTLDVLGRFPLRVVRIPPASFQHGRTRNLAAGLASPEVDCLVYLTQDATPLDGWLDALVGAVMADQQVVGAFSRHVPRPGCNPLLARRILEEWPQVGGPERVVKRCDADLGRAGTVAAHSPAWHGLSHFSNTSSCLRASAWRKIPFPEVEFAEDVAWAGQALRAGYSLVYEPSSAVVHSHSGSLLRQFQENVDHGWGMRRALGDWQGPLMAPRHSAGERLRRDLWAVWDGSRSPADRVRWTLALPLWYAASLGGQWAGARLDRWPAWLRARMSWQAAQSPGRAVSIRKPLAPSR